VLAAIALPASRFWLAGPPPPPSTASFDLKRRYWMDRLKNDPSDVEAYVSLGSIEEKEGFYLSARRRLLAARALGAPDRKISAPLGRALSHLAREEEARVELEKAAALAPDALDPVLNLAGFHVDARRSRQASEVLRLWVKAHPDYNDPVGLERLVLALLACGETVGADKMATRLVEVTPDAPGALSLAARCALDNGAPDRALKHLEKFLPSAPDPAAALYLKGLILNRLKRFDDALASWLEANRLMPGAPDVVERIGLEYARRGDFKRAGVALDQIATVDQGYPSAVRAARALEKAGRPEEAAYWDAIALGLRGDFQAALTMARKAAETTDPIKRRRARTAEAEALRGLKRIPEFVRTIEDATTGGSVEDLLLRAYAYFQAESPQTLPKRLACLRAAAEKAPQQRAAIALQVAEQLRRTGQRDAAEKEMEDALAVAPDDPELVRTLGGFYLDRVDKGERLAKATRLSEKAVALSPQDEKAWLQLGQCYVAKGDLARAAQCIEHVIDLEPGYGPGYLELSRVYARIGDKDGSNDAMALYRKYVGFEQRHDLMETRARSPKATVVDIRAYAELLIEAGDLSGATSQYERIMSKNPKDKPTRNMLKQLYARLGRTEQLAALEADR